MTSDRILIGRKLREMHRVAMERPLARYMPLRQWLKANKDPQVRAAYERWHRRKKKWA